MGWVKVLCPECDGMGCVADDLNRKCEACSGAGAFPVHYRGTFDVPDAAMKTFEDMVRHAVAIEKQHRASE